jgi:hypothetical protein
VSDDTCDNCAHWRCKYNKAPRDAKGIFASLRDTEREVDLQKREIEIHKRELEEAHALADLTAKPTMMGASQVRGRGYGTGPHEVRPQEGTSATRGRAPTIPPPHGQVTLSRLHKCYKNGAYLVH